MQCLHSGLTAWKHVTVLVIYMYVSMHECNQFGFLSVQCARAEIHQYAGSAGSGQVFILGPMPLGESHLFKSPSPAVSSLSLMA